MPDRDGDCEWVERGRDPPGLPGCLGDSDSGWVAVVAEVGLPDVDEDSPEGEFDQVWDWDCDCDCDSACSKVEPNPNDDGRSSVCGPSAVLGREALEVLEALEIVLPCQNV